MKQRHGFALMTVILMIAVLMALVAAYFMLTRIEIATTKSSADQASGFYAAEAGLNLRAAEIRATFLGYNRPSGSSPSPSQPCAGGNLGSGDFACKTYTLNGRQVRTYVVEHPGNPTSIRIPPGEKYQNLNAQEYRYSVFSVAVGPENEPEAILEMRFKSRLVPLFQFAAFYDKDLEILPGPAMVLSGPVHSNGDLYLNANTRLQILGQVTTAGDLYHGRKDTNACRDKPVEIPDRNYTLKALPSCPGGTRRLLTDADLADWGVNIQTHVDAVTVPAPEALDPEPGRIYWDKADLRLVLDLTTATPTVKVFDPGGFENVALTSRLASCSGGVGGKAVGYSNTFYNPREETWIEMLDVDVQALLDCAHSQSLLYAGRQLDDTTEGGLVFHFTVKGPQSAGVNPYGVRLRNAAELKSTLPGAPAIRGLTVVSDQAVYLQGDYNAVNKKPAAVLADSLNVLSNNWDDGKSGLPLNQRPAVDTVVNAALLAGTDLTGGSDGSGGQDQGHGSYNGGLENYPRFHENWGGVTLKYRGSFVSLGEPRHVDGPWCGTGSSSCGRDENGQIIGIYNPPRRDWNYDTDFNDASKLPPLSPRFVYLRQELFEREFEQP